MNSLTWNALDWALLTIALFCLLRGVWRGAVSQVFGIAGALGGFLMAAHFHEGVAVPLGVAFPALPQPKLVSFLILFFLAWFCTGGVGFWLSGLLRRKGLGFADRVLGGGVGVSKALVLGTILISMLTFFLPSGNPLLIESVLAPYVQDSAQFLIKITPARVQETFNRKREDLKDYWSSQKGPDLGARAPHADKSVMTGESGSAR